MAAVELEITFRPSFTATGVMSLRQEELPFKGLLRSFWKTDISERPAWKCKSFRNSDCGMQIKNEI